MPLYTEEDITNALNALVNGKYKSVRKAAIAFQISSSTSRDRQKNRVQEQEVTLVNNYKHRLKKIHLRSGSIGLVLKSNRGLERRFLLRKLLS
jgi:CMP-N-acetylneuraminic acid synthetase